MKEQTIFLFSIMISLLGLFFLYIYAGEVQLKPIGDLDHPNLDQTVRVEGLVTKVSQQEKVFFLQIEGKKTETMNIIFFPREEIVLHSGEYVDVTGLVEEYDGKKEIIADKVIKK